MAKVELVMPKMGESIMEATIIKWVKKPGDTIQADETVLEIATDKVDSEVPSPTAGVLVELRFKDGDVVPVGEVIAIIDTESVNAKTTTPAPAPSEASVAAAMAPSAAAVTQTTPSAGLASAPTQQLQPTILLAEPIRGRFYSPLVLNIARQEGIQMEELDRIPGTGNEGRVTKKDMMDYLALRSNAGVATQATAQAVQSFAQPTNGNAEPEKEAPQPQVQPARVEESQVVNPSFKPMPEVKLEREPAVAHTAEPEKPQPEKAATATGKAQAGYQLHTESTYQGQPKKRTFSIGGEVEVVEMDRMRKMIAENMAYSMQTSPHVTSFVEADVTNMVLWREKHKHSFEQKHGEKITFTPLFIEAVAKALGDFPMVNIAVDGDKIILRKDINVGMAVALPSGNLIVPTIRNADRLNLAGLTKAVNDLTNRGRTNKLTPDDISDGSYTLSNVGSFGNVMGTPIIMQPQVAVLAVGVIKKKPVVLETESGDVIAIRHMMFLSHSYDHRVIDGALGGRFVRRVADYLEQFSLDTAV